MIDTSKIIYVPKPIKILVIFILLMILGSALYFTYFYVQEAKNSDWVIVSLSIAQISSSGLVLFLLLIYAERGSSVKLLRSKSEEFIKVLIPRAFDENAIILKDETVALKAEVIASYGPLFHFYKIYAEKDPSKALRMGLVFNLRRLAVYLYLPKNGKHFKDQKEVEAYFEHGFKITESVGYSCSVTESTEPFFNQRCYILAFTHENLGNEFIDKPTDKLFFAQDISEMVKWYLSQEIAGDLDFL